jgi:hypothetical protein
VVVVAVHQREWCLRLPCVSCVSPGSEFTQDDGDAWDGGAGPPLQLSTEVLAVPLETKTVPTAHRLAPQQALPTPARRERERERERERPLGLSLWILVDSAAQPCLAQPLVDVAVQRRMSVTLVVPSRCTLVVCRDAPDSLLVDGVKTALPQCAIAWLQAPDSFAAALTAFLQRCHVVVMNAARVPSSVSPRIRVVQVRLLVVHSSAFNNTR